MSDDLTEYEQIANDADDREKQIKRTTSAREVITKMANKRYAAATAKQKQTADEFYEVVGAFAAKQITVEQADQLTGDGWLRAMVLSITPPDHPRYRDAMKMLDGIIALNDRRNGERFFTSHGWFSQQDLDEHGARLFVETDVSTGEMRQVIQFPSGVNPNTGERMWPDRRQKIEGERQHYISPYRADWYDDEEDTSGSTI